MTSDEIRQAARERAGLHEEFYIIIEPAECDGRGVPIGPGTEDDMRARLDEWDGLFKRYKLAKVVEDYEEEVAPLP